MTDRWIKIKESQLKILIAYARKYTQHQVGTLYYPELKEVAYAITINEAKLQLNDKKGK